MLRQREIEIPAPRGDERELLARVVLPDDLMTLAAKYEDAGGPRRLLLWQWAWYHLALAPAPIVLSCVPEASLTQVARLKFHHVMANTIFNDLAHTQPVADLVGVMAQALSGRGDAPAEPLPTLFATLVAELVEKIQEAPCGPSCVERVRFGVVVESVAAVFGGLIRRQPSMLSHAELRARMRDTMGALTLAEIDLAYSPSFISDEHGPLRVVMITALEMLRISNWLGTWKRELGEGDVASGVVSLLRDHERLPVSFLEALQRGDAVCECLALVRASGVDAVLGEEWCELGSLLLAQGRGLGSIEIAPYLEALAEVHRTLVGAGDAL